MKNVSEKCNMTANDHRVLHMRGHAKLVNETGQFSASIVHLKEGVVLITGCVGLVTERKKKA